MTKRLWHVRVEVEFYAVADSESAAELDAPMHAREELHNLPCVTVTEVDVDDPDTTLNGLDEALPYGTTDDKTVRDVLEEIRSEDHDEG